MFAKMAGDENLPSRNAYVEFTNQRAVPTALAYNGVLMNNRHLKYVLLLRLQVHWFIDWPMSFHGCPLMLKEQLHYQTEKVESEVL